ncbi:hypothetical protein Tco_0335266 [Tanacetum coccineum]
MQFPFSITWNFMPPKPDLVLADVDEYVFSESITSVPAVANSKVKTSEVKITQNSSRTKLSVNTARPINTVYPRPTVNCARPVSNVFNRAHSHVRRPLNKFTTNKNSNFNEKVNIVKGNVTTAGPKAVVSNNRGNEANVVKASTCWIWRPKIKVLDHVSRNMVHQCPLKDLLNVDAPRQIQGNPQQDMKDKGVIDSRCSRHMTGNRSYLTDYEYIDGGFAAFGGSTKGGKITRKEDNMYSVYLKNVVPQGGLTCLFAKATPDESNLWHRRLGHAEVGESGLVRPSRYKRQPTRVEFGDKVMLEVSSWKDVVHLEKKEMLAPIYKYLADTNLHVHLEEIKVDKTYRFVQEHVGIIDREVKSLKRSRIPIVKSIGT